MLNSTNEVDPYEWAQRAIEKRDRRNKVLNPAAADRLRKIADHINELAREFRNVELEPSEVDNWFRIHQELDGRWPHYDCCVLASVESLEHSSMTATYRRKDGLGDEYREVAVKKYRLELDNGNNLLVKDEGTDKRLSDLELSEGILASYLRFLEVRHRK